MSTRLAAIAVSLLLAHAAGGQPLCDTRVRVEPENAFVGQQVVYRLQILRHTDVRSVRFARDLSFPSFRAEWLPGQTPDPAIAEIGDHLLVFEERRALFPMRAGELAIPPARLACTSAAQTVEVAVPAARVAARALPVDGQPPGFRGVVGSVAMQAHVTQDRIELGGSLSLVISATGAANLWDAADPFEPARDLPGVDIYPRATETELDAGRQLVVRRTYRSELVPRTTGTFTIATLRVPYFDPETERYAVAETAPMHFAVDAAAPTPAAPPHAARVRGDDASSVRALALLGVALFLAMGAGLAGFALAFGRRRRQRQAPLRAATPRLAEAAAAQARGDRVATAHALAAALRAALEARAPGASALTAEELALRSEAPLRAIGHALRDLDRARFAPDARTPNPIDVARTRELIRAL